MLNEPFWISCVAAPLGNSTTLTSSIKNSPPLANRPSANSFQRFGAPGMGF
jgi:hypothetical protein